MKRDARVCTSQIGVRILFFIIINKCTNAHLKVDRNKANTVFRKKKKRMGSRFSFFPSRRLVRKHDVMSDDRSAQMTEEASANGADYEPVRRSRRSAIGRRLVKGPVANRRSLSRVTRADGWPSVGCSSGRQQDGCVFIWALVKKTSDADHREQTPKMVGRVRLPERRPVSACRRCNNPLSPLDGIHNDARRGMPGM